MATPRRRGDGITIQVRPRIDRDLQKRRRDIEDARRAFTRAAAALTELPTTETLAFALLEGAIGLKRIADADVDAKAKEFLLVRLDAVRRQKGEVM